MEIREDSRTSERTSLLNVECQRDTVKVWRERKFANVLREEVPVVKEKRGEEKQMSSLGRKRFARFRSIY